MCLALLSCAPDGDLLPKSQAAPFYDGPCTHSKHRHPQHTAPTSTTVTPTHRWTRMTSSPSPHIPPRQWLVTFFVVLNSLFLFLSFIDDAVAVTSHNRRKSRGAKAHSKTHFNTKTATHHHRKKARRTRPTPTHGAQFGAFLTAIKVVFFFSVLPVVAYIIWAIASDPKTQRITRHLCFAAKKRVYRTLGWPLPQLQSAVSLPQQQSAVTVELKQHELEEGGTSFWDSLDARNEDETRKSK